MTKKYQTIQRVFLIFGTLCLCFNLYEYFIHKYSQKQGLIFIVECALSLLLIIAPTILKRRFHLGLPDSLVYFYWFFLWISVFLGTSLHFISRISFWDKILHFVSPMLLTAIGYGILGFFLRNINKKQISVWTFLLFGFAFAGLCGVFWEFWEFLCDSLGQMNLQRYATSAGKPLIGRAALMDTMGDLFTNTIGAGIFLLLIWWRSQNDATYFQQFQLGKTDSNPSDLS